ncbi:LCP family protein [Nocardioides panacisoli]|uniref:LCP family protein n=1 Tax=Nocardioides panacisoli TaxID=627624 RepID=A0ABP7IAR9_9ACTN
MTEDEQDDAVTGDPSSDPGRRRSARKAGRSRSEAEAEAAGKRRAPTPGRTVARTIGATLLALALATGVSVVMVYNHWNGNLNVVGLEKQLHDRPEKKESGPINILVMGSDTRQCDGCNIDGMTHIGARSDTTILIHLSADRKFAYGISIPRDTLVDRPACYKEDGTKIPPAKDIIWNDAYSVGGPACTLEQFEQNTGIRVDNYVVIDFAGFKDMVDALDGVEVCIPQEIYDPEHQITLQPGTREIKGDEALSYVRVRYTVGDGTDPNRIRRQQAFMASMINKAISAGMLARPDRIVGFMNALTGSLQTDFKNIAQIADVAKNFRGIGLGQIKFVTTPWVYSQSQPGRVEWTPEVKKLWNLVINDEPLTPEFSDQSISAADNPDGSTAPSSGSTSPSAGTTDGGKKGGSDGGLSTDAREAAGLCT